MAKISLTAWFMRNEKDDVTDVVGIIGRLTEEQTNVVREWFGWLVKWTDENRGDAE